jgi:hypothetical protein
LELPLGEELKIFVKCKKTYRTTELIAEENKIYKLLRKVKFLDVVTETEEEVVYFKGDHGKETYLSLDSELTGFNAYFDFLYCNIKQNLEDEGKDKNGKYI